MGQHVIIDGNNLWFAMKEHAPVPCVGRETLVKIIESWARGKKEVVTLVFDGPTPRGGLAKQMSSTRISVRFSAPETADDVIVRMVHRTKHPGNIRVITDDKAIGHEARARRCLHCRATDFVTELYPAPKKGRDVVKNLPDKPEELAPGEVDKWLDTFGYDQEIDEEPFEGFNSMSDD